MYTVWIRIEETLPWIELKGEYLTRREAERAANEFVNSVKIRIVEVSERRRPFKALAPVKATR